MKKICVFCGSSKGVKPIFSEKAELLADILVDNNIELVYGGSNIGLMKSIADRVLIRGGKVTGVMPANLADKEILHENITETILANDMQERKKTMEELSDGFITMPGGIGSMDEFFEMLCWNQLSLIHKPVGIYNIDHFYDPLINWLDHAVEMKFVRPEHRANIIISDEPKLLLEMMYSYQFQVAEDWVERLKEQGY
jgi:uncharacterized protein (TIGR00730 family)